MRLVPIRPENHQRYGTDWPQFSHRIRFDRAQGRCECRGECGRPAWHLAADGRCHNRHGQPACRTGSRVVLTVAHRNHIPEQRGDAEVFAACQGCHLHYDRAHHQHTRQQTSTAALQAQMYPLFECEQ